MKVDRTFFVDAPVDRVMAVMRNPALIEASEKSRHAVSVEIVDLSRTDEEHWFDIHVENHPRGLMGLDKSKTEKNKIAVRWNLKDASCQWQWTGGAQHAQKTNISGFDRLLAKEDGTEVTFSVNIKIAVPIFGRKFSKIVAREFGKEWPKYIELVAQWLGTHS